MNLAYLEYTNFAFQSLISKRPVEIFVFHNALNGISDFLKSEMSEQERGLINQNMDLFYGVKNIFETYIKGGSCITEIVEANYKDFNDLVTKLNRGNQAHNLWKFPRSCRN